MEGHGRVFLSFLLLGLLVIGNGAPTESDLQMTTEVSDIFQEDWNPDAPNYDGLRVCEPECTTDYVLCTEQRCNTEECCFDKCLQKQVCSPRQARSLGFFKKFLFFGSSSDEELDSSSMEPTSEEEVTESVQDVSTISPEDVHVVEKRQASISFTQTSKTDSEDEEPKLKINRPHSRSQTKETVSLTVDGDTVSSATSKAQVFSQTSSNGNAHMQSTSFRKSSASSSSHHSSSITKREANPRRVIIVGVAEIQSDDMMPDTKQSSDSHEESVDTTSETDLWTAVTDPTRTRRQIASQLPTKSEAYDTIRMESDLVLPAQETESKASQTTPFYDQILKGYSLQTDNRFSYDIGTANLDVPVDQLSVGVYPTAGTSTSQTENTLLNSASRVPSLSQVFKREAQLSDVVSLFTLTPQAIGDDGLPTQTPSTILEEATEVSGLILIPASS